MSHDPADAGPTARSAAGADAGDGAGVDVGGTFTDVGGGGGAGRARAGQVPTTPADPRRGVAEGLAAADAATSSTLAHGTTTATNAVLERDVARTVLVTTRGFRDLLVIGRQQRPSLYDLTVTKPAPLVPPDLVVTVDERVAADGRVVIDLTDDEVARVVDEVAGLRPGAVAVSLLFAYTAPDHEERLCRALADRLDVPITRSSSLLPEFREYERTSTCVLNAAVAPVMDRYLSRLEDRVPDATVSVMTGGGGTAGIARVAAAPVHTLLSGPAAGVVAAGAVARASGFEDAIALDMGGTSTDVCLIRGGRPEITTDAEIDGLPFRTPTVDIVTVGAGGGSVAWIDAGGALQVGPRSAGARPGPACYGHGGTEPTVTDAHCVLGHLAAGRLLGGGLRLDVEAARGAVATLPDTAEGAHGILTVVRATMARALRRVSTERGVDPAGLALVAYGGAGPLHASALARELGCAAVLVPPAPGVLSALGLLLAPARHEESRTVMADAGDDLTDVWCDLEAAARRELTAQGVEVAGLTRLADCRYRGQSHELRLDLGVADDDGEAGGERGGAGDDVAARLHAAHEAAYGYAMPDEPVTVVTLRVVVEGDPVLDALPPDWDQGPAADEHERTVGVAGRELTARVLHRAGLAPGDEVAGPALVEQPDTTTLLLPGDRAKVDATGTLVVATGGDDD